VISSLTISVDIHLLSSSFDMDGTLTMPGQIDFMLMRQRLQITDKQDILEYVHALPEAQRL
jgi:hypothetical protein